MKKWGDSLLQQKDFLNEDINEYFRYIKDEYISYKDVKILI